MKHVRALSAALRWSAMLLLALVAPVFSAHAALTVTPITWDVIGLDSNDVNVGPNHFPIGARVCTDSTPATNVVANYIWDTSNTYINLRPGTANPSLTVGALAANTCADVYFEVEVTRNALAHNTTRGYHIAVTADGGLSASTPTPRQLYVEKLISQSRNAVSDMQLSSTGAAGSYTSIAVGGTMNLMVGQTYFIKLVGSTATQGYEQIESFINFPNTIFQVRSVTTTYSAETSGNMTPPYTKLYGDACTWDPVPTSPNYRSCLSTGKAGGNITVTFELKILSVPGAPLVNPEPLSTLIYDFSGSSYHYNADYSASTRFANIINATVSKSFAPKSINPSGTSTLTFKVTNPGPQAISGVNFTDTLPSGVTISGTTVSYSGCGTPLPANLTSGDTSLSFTNISVAALSTCTISVTITSATVGSHLNTSGHLFIGTDDTGSFAQDTLVVSSKPAAPSSCTTKATMATWTLENYSASAVTNSGPFTAFSQATDVSATTTTATYGSATGSASGIANTATAPTDWSLPSATGNSGNSWGIRGGWLPANPPAPETATTPYFQFAVDATNYGGIGVSASYNLQGNWSNAGNWYILSSTDGTTWTPLANGAWSKANAWQTGLTGATSSTGNTTVYFRVFFAGAQYSGNPSATTGTAYLDGITISGCPRPDVPTLSKAFGTDPIIVGSASTLTFTLGNPNATALTGVGFSDTLPAGLVVNSTPNLSTTCSFGTTRITATAGASTISLAGAGMTASESCTISVDVKGTVAGQYTNTSGSITSAETGPNTTATGYGTDTLTVIAPPVIAKTFGASNLITNSSTSLRFAISNPNIGTDLITVAFTDTLPDGLVVADPNGLTGSCGGGSITASADTGSVSLAGATLAAGASCTFSVNVTGIATGLKHNTVTVTSTNGGTGNTATADLLVRDQTCSLAILKQVSDSPSGPWFSYRPVTTGTPVYYRFTVANTGDVPVTGLAVQDNILGCNPCACSWPASLPVANVDDTQVASCVPTQYVALASLGVITNTATVSSTNSSPACTAVSDTAQYEGQDPTAVTMGDVELIASGVSDFLGDVGANDLDAADLLALLRAWDPMAADGLEGAGREALLAALRAYLDPDGDGQIVVFHWETLAEQGTIGFYAERNLDGAWSPVNAQMLPGMIASPMGAQYWLADPGAQVDDDYQYRLKELDARGNINEYGPFDLRAATR